MAGGGGGRNVGLQVRPFLACPWPEALCYNLFCAVCVYVQILLSSGDLIGNNSTTCPAYRLRVVTSTRLENGKIYLCILCSAGLLFNYFKQRCLFVCVTLKGLSHKIVGLFLACMDASRSECELLLLKIVMILLQFLAAILSFAAFYIHKSIDIL